MVILGLSAFYHDSAAALVIDGKIVASAQEERFSRKKNDDSFPAAAIHYCLKEAGIGPAQIDAVVFYEKPFLKFERLLETYLAFAPSGFKSFSKAMPIWLKQKLFQKRFLISKFKKNVSPEINWKKRLLFSEHHLSHASSAFFPSPFKEAAIITIDGVGEWATTSVSIGSGSSIELQKEIRFPHSIGLLYSAFTYYLGFKVNSDEYKVMGLAPYGKPVYERTIIENLVDIKEDGSFALNMKYFSFPTSLTMTANKFDELFHQSARNPSEPLTQFHKDMAASVQSVTENIILKLAKNVAQETGKKNLCLSGGVALNCVANGLLQKNKIFDEIWIQPGAGDAGGALGAALAAWHMHFGKKRKVQFDQQDSMYGSFLGPQFDQSALEEFFKSAGATFKTYPRGKLIDNTVDALISGKVIGWMQGRMEFGPRALGARSIIADPRNAVMQKKLNLKVKFRESFRPFAPSVLEEYAQEWFDIDTSSPYMLMVAQLRSEKLAPSEAKSQHTKNNLEGGLSLVPAVTHIDNSARVQTINFDTNPIFHQLISRFFERTGCPMIVNTSFNVRGEPIVCSPSDAFRCFMSTNIDMLVAGQSILLKEEQTALTPRKLYDNVASREKN